MNLQPFHADLHCHSIFSDGTLSPSDLAARARRNGVTLWALTDHDETAGLTQAQSAAYAQGLDFLTGVEISASFAGQSVHIVGLGFDPDNAALQQGLAQLRNSRIPRAQEIGRQLRAVGIHNAYEGALSYASNPALVARTHFARFLVHKGYCTTTQEVFRHFLVEGKPGYVPHQWTSLQEAVNWIPNAQGIAVIAHPARYKLTTMQEHALFSTFKELGGHAIECVSGGHTPAEYIRYASIARDFGFTLSRGSDYHGPQESTKDLGSLPADPVQTTGVWELLDTRILRAPHHQKVKNL